MQPYYALGDEAQFAQMFEGVGWSWAPYVVTVGALCALSTSLLGGIFPIPRVMFSMARDGLIFRPFAYVERHLKTPVLATVTMGVFTGVLAMIFDIDTLADMMSIGTLLAYSLVSGCVLLLRYEVTEEDEKAYLDAHGKAIPADERRIFQVYNRYAYPTLVSGLAVKVLTFIMTLEILALVAMLTFMPSRIFAHHEWWAVLIFCVDLALVLGTVAVIATQPQSVKKLAFTAPLIPFLPALSIFCNIYLMFQLSSMTWLRFVIWLAIGFIIYACYGIWHSDEEEQVRERFGKKNRHTVFPSVSYSFDLDSKKYGNGIVEDGVWEKGQSIEYKKKF